MLHPSGHLSILATVEKSAPPYLLSQRAVALEEVWAHFCFPGHVDMAVGTIVVAADPFQEVQTHGHLKEKVKNSDPTRIQCWIQPKTLPAPKQTFCLITPSQMMGRDTTMHILNDLTLVFKHVRYCLHSAWGILQQKLSFFGLESTSPNAWCWLDYVYLVQRGKSSKI